MSRICRRCESDLDVEAGVPIVSVGDITLEEVSPGGTDIRVPSPVG